jgi:hypothetical protein
MVVFLGTAYRVPKAAMPFSPDVFLFMMLLVKYPEG